MTFGQNNRLLLATLRYLPNLAYWPITLNQKRALPRGVNFAIQTPPIFSQILPSNDFSNQIKQYKFHHDTLITKKLFVILIVKCF